MKHMKSAPGSRRLAFIEDSNSWQSCLAALVVIALAALCLVGPSTSLGQPLTGAIFSTDTNGAVDLNIYSSKDDVYLNGGPQHGSSAGLPDGSYYVLVTEPGGTVLGMSTSPTVTVVDGVFAQVYQLSSLVLTASSGFTTGGYDDTTNPGYEYKVWVSPNSSFDPAKTDNFKVKPTDVTPTPTPFSILEVVKFYDANADGIRQPGEPAITGWLFHVSDDIHLDRFTPISLQLDAGTYTVYELAALETNWVCTTADVVQITLAINDAETVEFGNVAIGQQGGLTLGFWSNKNGQAATTNADLTFLQSLNLVNANGSAFDPTTKTALANWLLKATATNMAYMLSAQLTAMELNTRHPAVSKVDGSAILYRPELNTFGITFNSGFITLDDLMTAANTSLGLHPITVVASGDRTYQEKLKNALDDANNNKPFYVLPASPLPNFSF